MVDRNARLGLWLFAVYLLLYGGFVVVAAFKPEWMERTPLAGVNVAIWYGFGLIVAAVVLALVYGWACGLSPAARPRFGEKNESGGDQP
jgi:uncharacterized membrane protein (DUF485 family)